MPRGRKPKTTRDEWGSISLTARGVWRLRYPGPDGLCRDGGRYHTRAEAEEARAQLRTSIVGGTWRPTNSGDSPTLADYCAAWLQRAELAGDLRPSSVALYRRHFERLVLPDVGGIELGRVPVARLTREVVMRWDVAARTLARSRAAGLANRGTGAAAARRQGHPARVWARSQGLAVPKTGCLPNRILRAWEEAGSVTPSPSLRGRGTGDRQYEQARTALSAVCTAAVEDGYLSQHPVRMRPGTKARHRGGGPRRAVRIICLDVLLAVAAEMPAPYGLAALLTTFAGLRGGEVFALAGEHLEYGPAGAVAHMRVERALIEIHGQPVTFGPPKSQAGVRSVAIPRQIGELLAEHHRSLGLHAAGLLSVIVSQLLRAAEIHDFTS